MILSNLSKTYLIILYKDEKEVKKNFMVNLLTMTRNG